MGRENGDKLIQDKKVTRESIKDKCVRWLGLGHKSESVNNYMISSNTRAIIYMSAVVLAISLVIAIKFVINYLTFGDAINSTEFLMQMLLCVMVFFTCAMSISYASKDLSRKKSNNLADLSYSTILIFSCVCLLFGFFVSLAEYKADGRIMTFIAMELIVICILAWRPFVSISIVTGTFAAFYLMITMDTGHLPSPSFTVGFIIIAISIMVTSISAYHQKMSEAEKDSSLVSSNLHLAETAVKDELTGVANMSFFRKRAKEILRDPTTQYHRQIFVYLDIENFRPLNEKYGFESGNAFIKKFAGQIIDVFYDGLVGRQGDDHFVVLCDMEDLEQRITRLRSYIYDCGFDTQTGLKAGGYRVKDRKIDPSVACDRARYACNSIKKHYDQDYCEYDAELDRKFMMRQYIVNNVDAAIDRGDIKVYYQPVCWAKNRKLCGYEALSKWEDPKHGFLPPSLFIPVLEEYHQVHKIDMVVVDTVCRDLRWLMDNGRPAVPVSLNFSRLDFELTDVVDLLCSCTRKYNILPEMIHVEVTESALSDKLESLHRDLDRLKDLGFPLWLDDFGSGYSSLNVLKDFSFDVMKIDMVFLSSFHNNTEDIKFEKTKAVLKNVVSMANDLGMHTLTEGVETLEEAEYLKSIGCERLQGYLFGKPMPLKDALVKITAGSLPVSEEFI
ncbi:MAG: EAL domain-containing protein [Saccharofermentans sp.]|nr:EAL domain-containing protein [Saccharofermentans sp.]